MDTENISTITVEAIVNAPIKKVWEAWTLPEHIIKWNAASDDWHTPFAENDPRVGGKFLYRMEAKNGSFGFDFSGIYEDVKVHESISYKLGDDRKVKITFIAQDNKTRIIEVFDPEKTYSIKQQHDGWQAILDNFKKYTEQTIS